jgi:hypothetical protein
VVFAAPAVGEVMLRLGRYAESERALGHAIDVAQTIGARSALAAASLAAAELADACNVRILGVEHLERALTICRELRLGRFLARAERLLGSRARAAAQSA